MPKRTPCDPQLILTTYMRLKNGAAVARELGIHRNTVYQVMRRFRGKCRDCRNEIGGQEIHCTDCKALHRVRMRDKRKLRLRAGLCSMCDEPISPPSRQHCAAHRLAHLEANDRYDAKRRLVHSGLPSDEQRARSVRSKYGLGGLAAWTEAGGKCEVCGVSHDETAVHMHHIDGNDKNNARENFACLCFHCHMLTERILGHPHLADLFTWFKSTYPNLLP